ncbi:MAG TPA: hypothetical protein VHB21_21925 [Minicystis sp.]|nr:hypothetical protein [Minicystis sp.]
MEQRVSWLRTGATAGLAFGVLFGLFQALMHHDAAGGAAAGVLGGSLFGVVTALIARAKSRELAAPAVDDQGEAVLFQGPANHFKGMEGVGGRLYLTRERLRFKSHRLNVQVHEASYPLDAILSVEPTRTLGLIPNGLAVELTDGRRERFVVNGRGEWVKRIRGAMGERRGRW